MLQKQYQELWNNLIFRLTTFKTEKYNMAQELNVIIMQLKSDNEMLLKELNELKIIYKEKCMEIPKLKA